ncbi:MAG TPA: NTP transferase domain-containing protein, partial [Thermoanaerobaculia bacterium]|nr:NTP transferase domain-containing protein [Thermoanaerobaculia bacterium]
MDRSTGAPVGVVLAGGASRRMGEDKALLPLGPPAASPQGGTRGTERPAGESLAAWAARRLAAVCPEVAVADRGRGLLPGLPSLSDGPGEGPAAGLLGASAAYPGRALLVLAADLPEVPAALLAGVAGVAGLAGVATAGSEDPGCDWAVPERAGRLEPLCAWYGPAALAALAAAVAAGRFALHSLAGEPGLRVQRLGDSWLARFGPPE